MSAQYVKTLACFGALALALPAGNKKDTPVGEAGDEWVEMKADIFLALDEVHTAVGADVPPGIAVVKVSIKPRGNETLRLRSDDFQLLSYKDGQKSEPYTPSQIASNSTIQLRPGQTHSIGVIPVSTGPVWGGMGGTMPQQLPGNGGGVGGAGGGVAGGGGGGGVEAGKVEESKAAKDNKLLIALKDKELKDGEIKDWESGLLYFPMDGKQKLKDLVLIYKSPAGRLVLNFRTFATGPLGIYAEHRRLPSLFRKRPCRDHASAGFGAPGLAFKIGATETAHLR